MPIPDSLCGLLLAQLELQPVLKAVSAVGGAAKSHMTDQSQGILKALERSNRKAWKALEVALAGETLWTKLDRAEVKTLRLQIRTFLDQMPLPELEGKEEFRKRCIKELREALG